MAIYAVGYDLTFPHEYNAFYECLESFPHVHVMDSLWLIQTDSGSGEIRDRLLAHINKGDALFVSRMNQDWAGAGTQCGDWLKATERQWQRKCAQALAK